MYAYFLSRVGSGSDPSTPPGSPQACWFSPVYSTCLHINPVVNPTYPASRRHKLSKQAGNRILGKNVVPFWTFSYFECHYCPNDPPLSALEVYFISYYLIFLCARPFSMSPLAKPFMFILKFPTNLALKPGAYIRW